MRDWLQDCKAEALPVARFLAKSSRLVAALLCLSALISVDAPPGVRAQEDGIRFERIAVEDGLSHDVVYAILQDRQGFLWFTTEGGGLNKYDGYRFTVYRHDPEDASTISHDTVYSIYEDRNGDLWVCTAGGLNRYQPGTGTFARFSHSAGQVAAVAMIEDHEGTLWVAVSGGLSRFDSATGTFGPTYQHHGFALRAEERLSGQQVITLYEDRQGELWIGTDGGLDRLDRESNTFAHFRYDPDDPRSLSAGPVAAILEDSQGVLWIAVYGGGLHQLDRSTGALVHYRHDPDDADSLGSDDVTRLLEDSVGRLWIGHVAGLDMLDSSRRTASEGSGEARFVHFRYDPLDVRSLGRGVISALYEDRAGILWIGVGGDGISKTFPRAGQFSLFQQGPDLGLSDDRVLAVHQDQDGVLWIGTYTGGLNKLDRGSGEVTVYRHEPDEFDPSGTESDQISAIYEDDAGVLWIGTGNGRLEHFDRQQGTFINTRWLSGYWVDGIAPDRAGNLWIGTSGGLYRLDRVTDAVTQYRHDPFDPSSLGSNSITALQVDRTGTLYVGTPGGGISVWDPDEDRFTHYRHDPEVQGSLSHNLVLSFYEEPSGILWVATYGGGLNRFDPATATFTAITEQDGMASDSVISLLGDSDGFLWLTTDKGLSRFDPRTVSFRHYNARDGLQSGEFYRGARFRGLDGELFFGGLKGLNTFFPGEVVDNTHVPTIVITSVKVLDQTVRTDLPPDGHLELSYQDNFVSFEFAALDMTIPLNNQYAYRMEGVDDDWVYAGERRRADYTDLRPGSYVFRVKGSNNDGIWNEEGAALLLTITPPFWRTVWFQGGVSLLLLVAAVMGYRRRVRGIEARSWELEKQVEERTREIEQRRRVAEGLRDILAVLNTDRPLEEVLDYIVAQASRLLGAGATILHRIETESDLVDIQSSWGLPHELADMKAIPFFASGADEAILDRQPHLVPDLQDMAAEVAEVEAYPAGVRWLEVTRQHYRSFLAVPLFVGDEVYGCLASYYPERHEFPGDHVELAVSLADQAALAIENARLRAQAEEAAVVEERGRLARELHDSVTQSLYSLTLLAEATKRWSEARESERVVGHLAQLGAISQQALREMRLLVYQLRPEALRSEGLVGALQQRLDAVERRAGVKAQLVVHGEVELSPAVEETLYRVAQEALNNALKHAEPASVTVAIRAEGDQVELEVADDGRGFDPDGIAGGGGMGLVSMRERVDKMAGTLAIDSEPGKGTRVKIGIARAQ